MAITVDGTIKLTKKSQASLTIYLQSVTQAKRNFTQFNDKLVAIDLAYNCFKASVNNSPDGVDMQKVIPQSAITVPIIASQVDTVVSYLADTFLSGYPLFPVVSDSENKEIAEKFEAILDFHSSKGRYTRHLAMILRDAAKYDFCAVLAEWDTMPPFNSRLAIPLTIDSKGADALGITKLRRLDPYNVIWDYREQPAEVATEGEYAGWVELMSRIKLKRLMNKLSNAKDHMNVNEAFKSKRGTVGNDSGTPVTYVQKPNISAYIDSSAYTTGNTWEEWLESDLGKASVAATLPAYANMYEMATIFARIIPSEHNLDAPNKNTPQIWKFRLINDSIIISAEPVRSPHDTLPVLIGQPIEDGFGYQTKSIAESQIPLQQGATDMFDVRINSSKRAINDRMLYDPNMIDPMDINNPAAAAKIPVRNLGLGKGISDAAKHLPFEANATSGALGDMQQTVDLSYMLHGINPFRQGQTVKGNRTMKEFDSIIAFSDLRIRMLALMLENQVFMPIKDILKLNIISHKGEIKALNFNTGISFTVTPEDFTDAVIEFKLADGYNPKSKLSSLEELGVAFQFLAQDPNIGQEYNVGDMFAHFMSLTGVKNLAQYKFSPEDKKLNQQRKLEQLGAEKSAVQPQQSGGQ